MTNVHQTIHEKRVKPSQAKRLIAFCVFAGIVGVFAFLWACAKGYINLTFWLGLCGFKQRYGYPCPGCGWTHAAQEFVTGHFLQAFYTQPASAFFCLVGVFIAIFALQYAVFGIHSKLLQQIFRPAGVKFMLIAAVAIILAGWLVTLIRTMLEK